MREFSSQFLDNQPEIECKGGFKSKIHMRAHFLPGPLLLEIN